MFLKAMVRKSCTLKPSGRHIMSLYFVLLVLMVLVAIRALDDLKARRGPHAEFQKVRRRSF